MFNKQKKSEEIKSAISGKDRDKIILKDTESDKIGTLLMIIAVGLCVIIAMYIFATSILIPNGAYSEAVDLKNSGKYEEAITAFEALGRFSDSADQIELCRIAIQQRSYDGAVLLKEEKKYSEAIAAFTALGDFLDSKDKINECYLEIKEEKYIEALSLMSKGQYLEAITILDELGDFRDSRDKRNESEYLTQASNIVSVSVGDIIKFGRYEQDGNAENGREEIEWKVLDVKDGKALLISVCALDCIQYNSSYAQVSWETSSLRKWLNNSFLNSAFGVLLQERIIESQFDAPVNTQKNTDPGNGTKDKVSILSCEEFEKYFSGGIKESRCAPTEYALNAGAAIYESFKDASGRSCGWWWLRSPGKSQDFAVFVSNDGTVSYDGGFVNTNNYGVRPVMWISLG